MADKLVAIASIAVNYLENMSDEHKITKQDKLVLTITLAAIFFGVFGIGLVGLLVTLSS